MLGSQVKLELYIIMFLNITMEFIILPFLPLVVLVDELFAAAQ